MGPLAAESELKIKVDDETMDELFNPDYIQKRPTLHQRLDDNHRNYSLGIGYCCDERSIPDATSKIEAKVEQVYSILRGKGPRAWWRRVNAVEKILYAGKPETGEIGLLDYINNARDNGDITNEYASMTINYLKDVMNTSMANNRSFKRALAGSDWDEKKAKRSIEMIDMLADEYSVNAHYDELVKENEAAVELKDEIDAAESVEENIEAEAAQPSAEPRVVYFGNFRKEAEKWHTPLRDEFEVRKIIQKGLEEDLYGPWKKFWLYCTSSLYRDELRVHKRKDLDMGLTGGFSVTMKPSEASKAEKKLLERYAMEAEKPFNEDEEQEELVKTKRIKHLIFGWKKKIPA